MQALGHDFSDPSLLEQALTHSTGRRGSTRHYERLEFLGDRVLGFVMANWLYRDFSESEADMARRFAALVDKGSCAEVARAAGVSAQVIVDEAARQDGVHRSDNLLGDVCEALIGALYLDGGLDAAAAFIRAGWSGRIEGASAPPRDPKSELQEWAQARGLPIPTYSIVRRAGPDHAPSFIMQVLVRGLSPAEAEGTSKQAAEKAAAAAFLKREKAS